MANDTTGSDRSTGSDRWRTAGLVVAVFAAVGVGLGLTGFVGLSWVKSRVGGGALGVGEVVTTLAFLQSAVVTLLIGPTVGGVVGAVVGTGAGPGASGDERERAFAAGVGSFFGFYVLALLALFLMSLALGGGDGGGGGANLGDLLVPVLEAGVPTALVGAAAALVGSRL